MMLLLHNRIPKDLMNNPKAYITIISKNKMQKDNSISIYIYDRRLSTVLNTFAFM